ncbi:MAG TPA: VCBS repeat-containing protein, partial [Opitutaceae bacterium]|nr:VCBS repeat-containing protein [Opitutaceae bacterium]
MPRDPRALPSGWSRRDFLKLAAAAGAGAALPGRMRAAGGSGGSLKEMPLAPRSGPRGATLFTRLSPQDTGIVTTNDYADPVAGQDGYRDPRMWADRFHVFEVGAVGTGVAMGDYDGDGRVDLFVVSKTESCRLFRNLGDWKFEDVTAKAGVGDLGEAARIWKQGACFV